MDIEIEYCVPCGHLDRAIRTQKDLLETYRSQLDTVALRTGSGGVFQIRIDGHQVWDARTAATTPTRSGTWSRTV